MLHVDEGEAGKGGEDEDVADYGDALQRKLLVIDGEQFVHCQELADDFFLVELDADERVFGNPFVSKRKIGYLLQALHVADNRILLALLLCFEVEFKSTYQFTIDFRQRQILLTVFQFDKFRKITLTTFITADSNQGIVLSDKFTALVVMLLDSLNKCTGNFRCLVLSEELFLQQVSGDELPLFFQFIESLVEFDSCIFNISIQVAGFAALAFGALLRLIPQGRLDTLTDIVFHSRTVHRDAHTHGGFSVFQQLGFLDEEKHFE